MEMSEKKKTPLSDLMDASLAKIREMVNSNTVVGQPITTPDGVTLIPVSRLSFGFGAGGSDYGKQPTPNFGGGAGAGVKVDPVAFLVVKDGITRVMPVAMPAMTTADRVLELVPEVMATRGKLYRQKESKHGLLSAYNGTTNFLMRWFHAPFLLSASVPAADAFARPCAHRGAGGFRRRGRPDGRRHGRDSL